jgi:hypothetical protein
VGKKLNAVQIVAVLLLHKPLNGWFELCRVIRRVDALACTKTARKRSVRSLNQKTGPVQTNNEANFLVASSLCFSDALISVRDGLLDIETV